MKTKVSAAGRLFILLAALLILALAALPASSSPEYQEPTGFNAIRLFGGGGTAVPALQINQPGLGMVADFRADGVRVFGIDASGKMTENGVNCFRQNATVTDTVSYTATVTAISTPTWVNCSMGAITGDAAHCAITHGTGAVTITVLNAAATPAANATGAAVNYEICGTPQ